MPSYTYEEIAKMKREAYDEGFKAGFEASKSHPTRRKTS